MEAHQVPPPLGFSRQEHWSGLLFPSQCMKVKEEDEKVGLKLNIWKIKIMAYDPITSWQIDGETVADFIFGGSKIIADGDAAMKLKEACSLE